MNQNVRTQNGPALVVPFDLFGSKSSESMSSQSACDGKDKDVLGCQSKFLELSKPSNFG
jgi:hypothetical protein